MKHSQENDTPQPTLATARGKTEVRGMSGVSSKASDETHERLDNLFRILKVLMDNKFTGYIKLNFTQGSLGRVEKFEEILKK